MGLGPLMAAHQARFNRYLAARDIVDTDRSRVWCFVGDGEMDEPESVAAVAMAGREAPSDLAFVVNGSAYDPVIGSVWPPGVQTGS